MMRPTVTKLGAFRAGASCGLLPANPRFDLCYPNGTLELPAETENTDSEEEGPETPPANVLENLGYRGPAITPWAELDYVMGHLWEDGREFTVYMIIHHLQGIHEEMPDDPVARVALAMVRRYADGTTRISPPAWWASWLEDLLVRWLRLGRDDNGEAIVLVQRGPPLGSRRPALWLRYMDQMAEYPDSIRAVVFRGLAGWLRGRIDELGPRLAVLGGMLRDVAFDRVGLFQGCTDNDRTVGGQMVQVMIEELQHAESQGLLFSQEPVTRLWSARWEAESALPLEDAWGNALEGEEVAVGLRVTRWLRSRLRLAGGDACALPTSGPCDASPGCPTMQAPQEDAYGIGKRVHHGDRAARAGDSERRGGRRARGGQGAGRSTHTLCGQRRGRSQNVRVGYAPTRGADGLERSQQLLRHGERRVP